MSTVKICGSCGKPVAAEAPQGLCPECLIKAGFSTEAGPEAAGASGFIPPSLEAMTRLFPQFEIIELIGKGGMGAVYKARQPGLDRLVALKILPPRSGADPGFAERFIREARALARLSHPSIVAVHDFGWVPFSPELAAASGIKAGEAERLHYLVMQYVDGPNLRELEQTGKLQPREALQIIPQICEALQFAHDEGVVHRDIKPENVLLDRKGRIKIADFGLAKMLGVEPQDMRLTGERDMMGTPHYMAPEQMERPHAVDHRADIYSLGVVFYEMLTGELPLGKFAPPSRKAQIDVRLDDVVLRALENKPERRYQHASEIKTDVETITRTGDLPPVAPAMPANAEKLEELRRTVKGPAIGLQVAGTFNLVAMGIISALQELLKPQGDDRLAFQIFALAIIVLMSLGCLIIIAGLKMKRLESYGLALAGTILAAFVSPIGLPLSIWSLLILSQREVREAFQSNAAARGRSPVSRLDRLWLGASIAIVALALVFAAWNWLSAAWRVFGISKDAPARVFHR